MPDELDKLTATLNSMLDAYRATAGGLAALGMTREPTRSEAERKVEEYRGQIRENPIDWNAFKMLAIALDVSGDREAARQALLKAYRLRHGHD